MRQARARLFGPVDAGLDLLHPPAERVLALVEPVDVAVGAGELALILADLHVAPHRHPIADLLAQQQPVDPRLALSHGAPPRRASCLRLDRIPVAWIRALLPFADSAKGRC